MILYVLVMHVKVVTPASLGRKHSISWLSFYCKNIWMMHMRVGSKVAFARCSANVIGNGAFDVTVL